MLLLLLLLLVAYKECLRHMSAPAFPSMQAVKPGGMDDIPDLGFHQAQTYKDKHPDDVGFACCQLSRLTWAGAGLEAARWLMTSSTMTAAPTIRGTNASSKPGMPSVN